MVDSTIPWTPYAETRPEAAGAYQWRVPSRACSGLVVTFFAHMRMRGAGYRDVLSPVFDYWDGYRVIVPAGTEWRAAENPPECKGHDEVGVVPEGVDHAPCPFCRRVPTIKGLRRGYDGRGVVVGAGPHEWNDWWLECCQWAGRPSYADPRRLADVRNDLLKVVAGGDVLSSIRTED